MAAGPWLGWGDEDAAAARGDDDAAAGAVDGDRVRQAVAVRRHEIVSPVALRVIELRPAPAAVEVVETPQGPVAEPASDVPPLTDELVRDVLRCSRACPRPTGWLRRWRRACFTAVSRRADSGQLGVEIELVR